MIRPGAQYQDPDGSEWLLAELVSPAAYQDHAKEVYERLVPLEMVKRIYAHEPLTEGLIRAVDPDADAPVVLTTARAVGFPVRG